ncbi:Efflux pump membrane transporter BepE [Polystyrenella longa]|uniref:Efflux pump membrane transporter BepE n=1 Tax=Polystyrenella longa TaxID=2528007 RepID=A0A518CNM9_9PLAN|nr:efflux RND transporter permease subunit [Polystyrenella longa]QDU80823.1 Efflux pump membrane transporter BepE [Polystyrenella longa]
MDFIGFAVRNPVKVTVAVIMAVLFGMISLLATPVQLTPDVVEPKITVSTTWPGASAQEVEREIIEEQEEQLKSVEGLSEFESTSSDSRGEIILKFEVGTDLGEARARVSDKLNQVPEYPEDANEPTITTVNPNENAIAWFILQPIPPSIEDMEAFARTHPDVKDELQPFIDEGVTPEFTVLAKLAEKHPALKILIKGKNDPALMKKFAEDFIESRFERVPGVANSNVFGGQEEEVRVVVDPAKLASVQLTITDLRAALQAQNKNTSAGDMWEGKTRNVIRTLGQFRSIEQVEQTVIAVRDNTPIRITDVAHVELNYKKPEGLVRQKGVSALAVNTQQAPETNVLEIMGPPREKLDLNGDGTITSFELSDAKSLYGDSLRIAVEEMNNGALKPRGVQLIQVYDQTEYVTSATDLVQTNIYLGGFLAIVILLIFLRSPRSVLIIGISIPISIIATFVFVRGFGRSINVISLAGMAFAVGMVVDNAIVVLENIFRHYEQSGNPREAAIKGTQEVWGAVLASTLTTLAVFVPVIFVEGQAGQLFRDISIAISCAVGLSLIVSITVIPTAAKHILKDKTGENQSGDSAATQNKKKPGLLSRFFGGLVDGFIGMLRWMQETTGSFMIRVTVLTLFIVTSLVGAWIIMPETEYLPEGNRNLIFAILIPPPGYNINQMIQIGESIEPQLSPYWEAKPGSAEAKALDGPLIDNFFFVARGPMLFMGARSLDPLRAAELIPVMRRATANIPGTFAVIQQSSLFESALSGGRSIEIRLTGPDLEVLVKQAQMAFGMCMQKFPMSEGNQLRPVPSLDLSSPEMHVKPNLEQAAELGMNTVDIGYAVNALVDGAYAGDFWNEGTKIDLVIYGADDYVRYSQNIGQLPLSTPTGRVVSLSTVADIELTSGPEQVVHNERQRSITIQLTPAPQVPLEQAMRIVNDEIRPALMEQPAFQNGNYQISLAGAADKLVSTRRELQWNLMLAVVITYLLMAALFESFIYPVVIMTSISLALVGGLIGLAFLNLYIYQALDMLTMLGFVILIGTVVNNAILIIHQSLNYIREEHMDDKEAILLSVRTRMRPIFMSTLTTVLGMLPLVVPLPILQNGEIIWMSGAGSELYRGLGSVVLGGLIVSTFFTLIVVPIGFSLVRDMRRKTVELVSTATGSDEPIPEPQPTSTSVAHKLGS